MNIAMILPSLANTGPGIVAKDLCTEFVKKGHTCKVFFFDEIEELEMPCTTQRIHFTEAFDFDNWDVIHSHAFRSDAYVWYHKRKIKKSKCISTLHNPISYKAIRTTYSFIHSVCGAILWPLFLSVHKTVVVLNTAIQSELPNSIRKKSEVVFNGRNIILCKDVAKLDQYDSIARLKAKYKIIGSVCSLTKRKGLDQIIKALPGLPDYAFVALGKGDQLEELQKLAIKFGISDKCLFLGFKNNATDYMALFDIFIMCSYSEGFPLALIEASAYGIPTVLSDIDILKAIMDKDSVCFYHLEDIADLQRAVGIVGINRQYYAGKIKTAYEKKMTATIMAENYMKVYKL